MPKKKLTIKQIRDIVDYEGLGYAIQNYVGHGRIANKRLSKLWNDAKKAMDKIAEILK